MVLLRDSSRARHVAPSGKGGRFESRPFCQELRALANMNLPRGEHVQGGVRVHFDVLDSKHNSASARLFASLSGELKQGEMTRSAAQNPNPQPHDRRESRYSCREKISAHLLASVQRRGRLFCLP
jgi:hypothetical protein